MYLKKGGEKFGENRYIMYLVASKVIMADTKICKTCLTIKPLYEFHKRRSAKDGRQSKCRVCSKKHSHRYREEHKEELNRKEREKRKKNIEKYKKKEKEQYLKHIECRKKRDRDKVIKLTDTYIKIYLRGLGIKEFTPELIKKIRAKIKRGRKRGRVLEK